MSSSLFFFCVRQTLMSNALALAWFFLVLSVPVGVSLATADCQGCSSKLASTPLTSPSSSSTTATPR
jgi:hypothetical protein